MHSAIARKPARYLRKFSNVFPWFFANRILIRSCRSHQISCCDRGETLVGGSIVAVTFNSDMNLPNQCLMSESAELIAQYLQRLMTLRVKLQFKTQARYSDLA